MDVPTWRSIQYLGDLRNLCDHDKQKEPTPDQLKRFDLRGDEDYQNAILKSGGWPGLSAARGLRA